MPTQQPSPLPLSTDGKPSITLWRLCRLDEDRQLAALRFLLEAGQEGERSKDVGIAASLHGVAVSQSDAEEISHGKNTERLP
jgi:hypothetical protein